MRSNKKIMALILAVILLFSTVAGMLTSCVPTEPECPPHTDDDGDGVCDKCEEPMTPAGDGGKTTYTVTVKTIGGMPLSNVIVSAYADVELDDLEQFGTTGADGVATLKMNSAAKYYAKLSGLPEGYNAQTSYEITSLATTITVSSSVIENTSLAGVTYKLGDIIRDFSFKNSEGETVTLSGALEGKDMVLINFWYTTCSWCVEEFPYMEAAYQKYKDDIAILAIDPASDDSISDIASFKSLNGLSFDMGRDIGTSGRDLSTAFNVTAYPTSVFVDRYGAICLVVSGAITGEKYFEIIFDHFTGTDLEYEQQLITSYEELAPREIPDVEMPSSDDMKDAFGYGNIDVEFFPETESADSMYSWPFVISEKDGVAVIKTSNAKKDSSYATLHADIALEAGEAIAFEYFCSTELGADVLYVLIDGQPIREISGVDTDWQTCYAWVAEQTATYRLSLVYAKDSSTDTEDDTVYFKKLRVVDAADVDTATYIPRQAATSSAGNGIIDTYVEVFLGDDGYYHVGSSTGPLLLANLLGKTVFSSENSVYTFIYKATEEANNPLAAYYNAIVAYCNYASNATISGVCTVNETLKGYLEIIAKYEGFDSENENEWLEMCVYYDKYGTDEHYPDPIAGLAPHSAFDAVMNEAVGLEVYPNIFTYKTILMPRGYLFAFTPDVSGAYRIISNVDNDDPEQSVDGWVFDGDKNLYYQYDYADRLSMDSNNVFMYVYFEAGTTYYIDIAYEDLYYVGSFGFKIEYLGEEYSYFRSASPGAPFTYKLDGNGEMTGIIIPGGVEVVLGEDDYYYAVLPDGTVGTSRLYADFTMFTSIFDDKALYQMIDLGAFDFRKTETDLLGLYFIESYSDAELHEKWGDEYDYWYEAYKMDDLKKGIYHGDGEDLTELARSYYAQIITGDMLTGGTVAVDKDLADLLQKLMDKYTFSGVKNSWTKLCYYYEYIGEGWSYTQAN